MNSQRWMDSHGVNTLGKPTEYTPGFVRRCRVQSAREFERDSGCHGITEVQAGPRGTYGGAGG